MQVSLLVILITLYGALTMTSMAGMSIGAAILILGACYVLLKERRGLSSWSAHLRLLKQDVDLRRLFWCALAYVLVLLLSTLQARIWPLRVTPEHSLEFTTSLPSDLLRVWYFPFLALLITLFTRFSALTFSLFVKGWLGASLIFAIWSPVQFATGMPGYQSIPELPGFFHARGLFGHHLSAASILIFPFYAWVALARIQMRKDKRLTVRGILYILGACSIALFLFLGWSRMLWIALPAGFFAYTVLRNRKRIGIALLGLTALALGAFNTSFVRDRIESSLGVQTRFELWSRNWELFTLRPVLGVGWRKTSEALTALYQSEGTTDLSGVFVSHAHNMVIELLSGVGVIGLLVWLLLNGTLLRYFWRHAQSLNLELREWSWAMLGAWLTLLLNGLTQVNFWEGKVQHQMMWSLALYLSYVWVRKSERVGPMDLRGSGENHGIAHI